MQEVASSIPSGLIDTLCSRETLSELEISLDKDLVANCPIWGVDSGCDGHWTIVECIGICS